MKKTHVALVPRGWIETTLADFIESMANGVYKSEEAYADDGIACLRMYNISGGRIVWQNVKRMRLTPQEVKQYQLLPSDLLVNRVNSRELVGKAAICPSFPEPVVFESKNIRLRLQPDSINANLLNYWLMLDRSRQHLTDAAKQTVGMATVSQPLLGSCPMLVPPWAEQKRIVAKLEEVLNRVNAARERLAKVPSILKRFRQSVLAAACSGHLTADWRISHETKRDGHVILDALSAMRKVPKPSIPTELPDLPSTWAWTTFGYVLGELRNGISTKPEVQQPGNPILRINAVRPGRVLYDDARFLPDSDHLIPTYQLRNGDLLFTRYNGSIDLLGVCGMVRKMPDVVLLYPDKLMRVRFDHEMVLPEYAEIFFQAPDVRERLTARAKSSAGQQGISGKDIKDQPFAVAPTEEQKEIARRVKKLFDLADKIEVRVAIGTVRTEKLLQSTLAKAFRGELVPTEAELAEQEGRVYETAEALLERIKASEASSPHPRMRSSSAAVLPIEAGLFADTNNSTTSPNGVAHNLEGLRRQWKPLQHDSSATENVLVRAFKTICKQNSPDRVVADPELHYAFIEQCRELGLEMAEFDLCFSLLNLRKGSELKDLHSVRKPVKDQWKYAGASEIAARVVYWRHGLTVDRIICHPKFVEEFEKIARSITPGFSSFEYRWAALGLRKVGKKAAQGVVERLKWSDPVSFTAASSLPNTEGVYALHDQSDCLFVYGTESISESVTAQTNLGTQDFFGKGLWRPDPKRLVWKYAKATGGTTSRQGIVNALVSQWTPVLNVPRVA